MATTDPQRLHHRGFSLVWLIYDEPFIALAARMRRIKTVYRRKARRRARRG
ncbi:hypothetical protein [Acrocarpospora sp. B8E8]|uniref:hypothetical protein n=1 Tax=Acrocarpospora sp. B8E8 TaxID=3153572 RepID=UPI00325DE017